MTLNHLRTLLGKALRRLLPRLFARGGDLVHIELVHVDLVAPRCPYDPPPPPETGPDGP